MPIWHIHQILPWRKLSKQQRSYAQLQLKWKRGFLPKQHRKPRILPLHPRHLHGRTDTVNSFPQLNQFRSINVSNFLLSVTLTTYLSDSFNKRGSPILRYLTLSRRLEPLFNCLQTIPKRKMGRNGLQPLGSMSFNNAIRFQITKIKIWQKERFRLLKQKLAMFFTKARPQSNSGAIV